MLDFPGSAKPAETVDSPAVQVEAAVRASTVQMAASVRLPQAASHRLAIGCRKSSHALEDEAASGNFYGVPIAEWLR